jgi:hypothetical protein
MEDTQELLKNGVLPVTEVDNDKRLVGGWLYIAKLADGTQVVDVSGDIVDDVEELEKAAHDFVTNSRSGDVMHDGRMVARLVESIVTEPERMQAMGVTQPLPVGWYGVWKIEDDEVWKRVKNGELRAFSVAGRGVREPI